MESKELIKIIGCQSTLGLARKISKSLDIEICNTSIVEFSDGEFEPSFDETIRGSHVFLVQSTTPPSENLMELLLMKIAEQTIQKFTLLGTV